MRKRRWTFDHVVSDAWFSFAIDLFKDGLSLSLTIAGKGYWLDTYLETTKAAE